MLFNSWQFFVFFPVVSALYFLLPHRFRWILLFAASCFFYAFFIPAYLLLLFFVVTVCYYSGVFIERLSCSANKRAGLTVCLVLILGVLIVFKYFNFFNSNISALARYLGLNYPYGILKLILPIGLSFYVFQGISYVFEVYKGRIKSEKHFGIFSLYIIFYPQMVAGPIERPQNLLPQFYVKHEFDYKRVADGLKLMAWGLFKKVVIADRLALFVGLVYSNPHGYGGASLMIATVFFFAFQIYCDFSGYSDIAIGAAQVMGFKLMDNFARPYF